MLAVLFSLMTLGGDRGIVRLFYFLFPVFLPSQITSCKLPSSACHVLLFFLLLLISFRICVIFSLSCSAFPRWQAIPSTSLLRCHCSISPAVGGLFHGGLIEYSAGKQKESEQWVAALLPWVQGANVPISEEHFLLGAMVLFVCLWWCSGSPCSKGSEKGRLWNGCVWPNIWVTLTGKITLKYFPFGDGIYSSQTSCRTNISCDSAAVFVWAWRLTSRQGALARSVG